MGKLEGEGGGGAAAQQGGQLTGARLGSGAAAPEGRVGVNLNPTKFCQILALSYILKHLGFAQFLFYSRLVHLDAS